MQAKRHGQTMFPDVIRNARSMLKVKKSPDGDSGAGARQMEDFWLTDTWYTCGPAIAGFGPRQNSRPGDVVAVRIGHPKRIACKPDALGHDFIRLPFLCVWYHDAPCHGWTLSQSWQRR
jgi:hypothetical protein